MEIKTIIFSIILFIILFIVYFTQDYFTELSNKKKQEEVLQKNYEKAFLEEKVKKKTEDLKKKAEELKIKNIYYKGDDKWKFTKDDNDIDCLINWDYYDSDKKTLIKSNIPRITTLDKNNKWCATKNATEPTDRNIKSLTDKYGNMAIGAGIKTVIIKGSKKLLSSATGKLLKQKLMGTLKTKIISKISFKMQSKLLTKLAKNISQTVTNKLATKMAATLAKTAGKSAAKIGLKSSTQLAKLAIKLKPSPLIIFDLLSMGLDMGDAGGYEKLQTKGGLYTLKSETEKILKKGFYESIKKTYEENGETLNEKDFIWPVVFDPLENDPESFDDLINKKIESILQDENNTLAKPIFDAIDRDLESGKITQDQLDNDTNNELFNSYVDKLDIEQISNIVYEDWCKSKGGIIYDNNKCTLPESTCNNWPLKKDMDGNLEEPYKEFKNGKCIIVDPSVREKCDEMGLSYDMNTGICKIDENYCKSKGAEWRQNKNINNEYDCIIPIEQDISEAIFGKTVVRGLKQIFDAEQYYGCGFDGPINIKGKCIDMPGGEAIAGLKPIIWDCDNSLGQKFYYNSTDNTIRTINNYENCFDLLEGKSDIGTPLQLWTCNGSDAQKFIYDEKTKNFKLKSNQNKCLDLIGGSSNNGNKFQLWDCNGSDAQKFDMTRNILSDNGLVCDIVSSRVADCPTGYTNNGLTCGRGTSSKSSDLGNGAYVTVDCPTGTINTGGSCLGSFGRGSGRDDVFYDGWAKCAQDDGDGDRNNCEKWGTRVYPKCQFLARKKGYDNPDNWTNDACCMCSPSIRDINKVGKCTNPNYPNQSTGLCYIDCEKKYGPGYYNNGTSCWRDADTKGEGSMKCNTNEDYFGGRCYPKCPPDYTDTGLTCHRRKYRKIEFSTKDN